MFNATTLLRTAGTKKQLTNYYRSDGFNMLLTGLLRAELPEHEIMRTTRGNSGCTMLHRVFLLDFLRWTGNARMYYDGCAKVAHDE